MYSSELPNCCDVVHFHQTDVGCASGSMYGIRVDNSGNMSPSIEKPETCIVKNNGERQVALEANVGR